MMDEAQKNSAPPRGLALRLRQALRFGRFNQLGSGTKFNGKPYIANGGEIHVGANCLIGSRPIQSHLESMPGAKITIGDGVVISFGAAISARQSISIGNATRIGPFCVILDNDFHKVGDRNSPGVVSPVEIGSGVTIGARVTILRGARIGDGARIMSGSSVSGVIAANSIVSGVPARVATRKPAKNCGPAVTAVAMRVFGLPQLPAISDGPEKIAAWTLSGGVRLLLALEESFEIKLPERAVMEAPSLASLAELVAQTRDMAERKALAN